MNDNDRAERCPSCNSDGEQRLCNNPWHRALPEFYTRAERPTAIRDRAAEILATRFGAPDHMGVEVAALAQAVDEYEARTEARIAKLESQIRSLRGDAYYRGGGR